MTTAAAAISKTQEAERLRAAIAAGSEELSELQQKLARTSGVLASLQSRRDNFANDAADGRAQKPAAVAALHAEIAEAQLPVEVLQRRLTAKQGELDHSRAELETLNREIALEAQAAARRGRFDALAKQGTEVAEQVSEMLRVLIQEKLPVFDAVRDSLTREFPGTFPSGEVNGDELAHAARALLAGFNQQFFDGPFLRIERKLLREGWQAREDLVFTVKNLRPPRR